MSIIQVENLTKSFTTTKGIFNLSLTVNRGEVFGFIGPNGAGKTTTIRHLLGFTKPLSGKASILNLDCWSQSPQIQRHLGYLPAEIAFPENLTGMHLIRYLSNLRKLRNLTKAEELIHRFELDPSGKLSRMSKGTKQKVGIVCAFMHDPEILILDEPTTGLDPLMQAAFINLVKEEKQKGKSILMSSHVFEEIESTCDRIGIIKQGRIISNMRTEEIRKNAKRTYAIEFFEQAEIALFENDAFKPKETHTEFCRVVIEIEDAKINELLRALSTRNVKSMREIPSSLEQHFRGYYKGEQFDV